MNTNSKIKKSMIGFFFGLLLVLTFLNIHQNAASKQLEIYGWSCRAADICGRIPGFMCYWDSWNGYRPCPEENNY
ncbi:MAG: hypothetical protein Q8K98_14210 [Bacteroidota bacterium]|nr:hypothetical protein [Bacteroidota bacterium]